MLYKAKVAVCSDIRTNAQHKASAMYNFWMLNLVERKVTAGL